MRTVLLAFRALYLIDRQEHGYLYWFVFFCRKVGDRFIYFCDGGDWGGGAVCRVVHFVTWPKMCYGMIVFSHGEADGRHR